MARVDLDAGKIDATALRKIEDAAIRAVVAQQEEIGLRVVTDGEFRRRTYSDSFTTGGIAGIKRRGDRGRGLAEIRHARPSHRAPHPGA